MIWTSRLALIAYLLGGWLLPAAHHHVHPHAGECQHLASTNHHHGSGHGCCSHEHSCDDGSDAAANQSVKDQVAAEAQLAPAPALLICDGLCALCSARSMTSTTLKQKPNATVQRDGHLVVQPIAPAFTPATPAGEHPSRGPPEIA